MPLDVLKFRVQIYRVCYCGIVAHYCQIVVANCSCEETREKERKYEFILFERKERVDSSREKSDD